MSDGGEYKTFARGLAVLEALEGIGWEPVSLSTIIGRTGFSKDFCLRALRTLRSSGWAHQDPTGKWTVGIRLISFGGRIVKHKGSG